jgi:hypothetical protein
MKKDRGVLECPTILYIFLKMFNLSGFAQRTPPLRFATANTSRFSCFEYFSS